MVALHAPLWLANKQDPKEAVCPKWGDDTTVAAYAKYQPVAFVTSIQKPTREMLSGMAV